MPDTYLDLYKLRETLTPFKVERIIDEDLQSSPGCQLPTDNPLNINLEAIDVILPPLDCKFDNLVPLIPLPEVCHPTVAGNINIVGCSGTPNYGTANIVRIPDTCDYVLSGDIEVCVPIPCPDGYTFSGGVSISSNTPVIQLDGDIDLVPDGPCGALLLGTIELSADLDNVCTEQQYYIEINDETPEVWEFDLGGEVTLQVYPVVTITKTNETKCETTFLFSIDIASSTLTGASWEDVEFCDGGTVTTKKILVA